MSSELLNVDSPNVVATQPHPSPFQQNDNGELACRFCGIRKVLADSRLHEGGSQDQYWLQHKASLHEIQTGATHGCRFCGLALDALTRWKQRRGWDNSTADLTLDLSCLNASLTLLIVIQKREDSEYFDHFVVFRGRGECC